MTPHGGLGQAWLGDLLRGFASLQPGNEATRTALAAMLGLQWTMAAEPAPAAAPPPAPPPPAAATPVPPAPAANLARADADPPQLLPWTLRDDDAERTHEWRAVPALAPYVPGSDVAPPHWPLFQPQWQRVLAATLAGSERANGTVDAARLVRIAARGLPLRHIPRRRRWSLAPGVQLLIDEAPGMEPFRLDQIEFAALLRDGVGAALVQTLAFADCPSRGVFGDDGTLAPYRWPEPGVPVLVLSDLGLGAPPSHLGRARSAEWLDYAARLRARGTPLRVLVPHVRARWPAALRGAGVLVEWDRGTTSSRVRRQLQG